jgi:hypothetical protein
MRTYPITAEKQLRGAADFLVLLGTDAGPEAVRFVSGDEKLRSLLEALRQLQFGPPRPNAAPAKILRRGTMM